MVVRNNVVWYCVVVDIFLFVFIVVVVVVEVLFVDFNVIFEEDRWVYVFCVFLFYLFVKSIFYVNSKFFVVD